MPDDALARAREVAAEALKLHEPPLTGLDDEYNCCAAVVVYALRDAGLLPAVAPEVEHGIRTQLGDHVAANDDVVLLPKEVRLVRSVWRSEWRPVEAGP